MTTLLTLAELGWHPFFQQQLSLDEWEHYIPARVFNYERSLVTAVSVNGRHFVPITSAMPAMTVGDWLLLSTDFRFERLLTRLSQFSRKAAGNDAAVQLIAANVDSVFIMSSLNKDFNLNRIERYLTLAHEAHVEPVIVLTKADLCKNTEDYVSQVTMLDGMLAVVVINCLDSASVDELSALCRVGKTIALMGSSGVGKSSLLNTLMGQGLQATRAIRNDDDKGRHTTTSRSLHVLPNGTLLLDTPGMRELQLSDCDVGIEGTFPEIASCAQHCRFVDCRHDGEPGCAVLAAIAAGNLDGRRLVNFRKLLREQALNSATLAEKRARERKLGRFYRTAKFAHDLKRKE
jgi:ribosome biogenesis GTPase / thiamine phosphate phosphatase